MFDLQFYGVNSVSFIRIKTVLKTAQYGRNHFEMLD